MIEQVKMTKQIIVIIYVTQNVHHNSLETGDDFRRVVLLL